MNQSAFTYKADGLANQLVSDAKIVYEGNVYDATALWDTGASGSCISHEVVERLGLKAIQDRQVLTPGGINIVKVYLVDVVLPNNVGFKALEVCDSEIGAQGLDMLIGMDIISNGTFTVSNYNGKTAFSYKMPSDKMVDYAAELKIKDKVSQGHRKKKK